MRVSAGARACRSERRQLLLEARAQRLCGAAAFGAAIGAAIEVAAFGAAFRAAAFGTAFGAAFGAAAASVFANATTLATTSPPHAARRRYPRELCECLLGCVCERRYVG